ncbi:quinone-dependent dihydroorotate dehydrogenase [Croceicoccus sp. YJ47]|uniref:quinone-dependent dihydroorotate dehydrogenase n=1 Tax=Croceicoccus sp. YJ47 TaxID=2798724 RepID=UPI001923BD2D|nr:quinone-dependent dihydroorotate dehydrogenase [Croceicoccus sp. YJ47]QQN74676.1 quinone-dependent dihydroorotate dehydrogenase [Croceicoccus sp. YJ47]
MIYPVVRPLIFRLDAERAHGVALRALKTMPSALLASPPLPQASLASEVAGLRFPNPVGMAAGFDKNGEVPDALLRCGFGFAELGSVTPRPQAGNPRPRMFRLAKDRAVINRLGFNNEGADAVAVRMRRRARIDGARDGIVGINIGANKDSADRIDDYARMTRTMAPYASYLAVNISSPNTPGLRALQDEGALTELLDAVNEARGAIRVPVFLKVAPDLEPADIDAIARIAADKGLGALMVSNTTVARPPLASRHADEAGGLSGAPLREMALMRLRDFRKATGGTIPLIGIGGIFTAEDAWERIRAGASLVQLYSAMVYEGPGIAAKITRRLPELMRRDGFSTIAEAVGSE